ncbi:MMPL family transporter [Microbacterium amylolyticum]|uniref:RND superfamily putative drug exporter n=1 Tax=Microbacterium amylolyticum TaxID=936337 RepID=A0ABS4ZJ93_9MICO|nr:MMPL family transporter [Microbacterium amylolyticum]MBP2437346.1 RND superfamily putative drug exporter [Microbacterium amylolyticum]
MSTLLSSLGRWSFRHPWRVLGTWILLLVIMGGSALTLNKGFDDSFSIPGTESQEGLEQLNRTFPQVAGTGAQIIIVTADGAAVDDAAYREPIEAAIADFEQVPEMSAVTSPYEGLVDGSISDDGNAAIVQLQLDGQATTIDPAVTTAVEDRVDQLRDELPPGSITALGGDLYAAELPALSIVEVIGVIVALIVLIVAFRAVAMAGVPLAVALIGVGISMLGLLATTQFATVSATTPMLALMLGLAVGIDYSLFIAARAQDAIRAGTTPEDAASRATGTAGSAVVFAGVTVLIALIGLGFAGIPFLTTMGIAAAAAVAIAVLISVSLTPAFLGFVGHRAAGRAPKKPADRGFARRWVTLVTKHPIVTTVSVVLGLGIVALPAANLQLALPNAGVLPEQNQARQAYDLAAENFGEGVNGPLILTGTIITSDDPLTLMEDLGDEVAKIDGVADVVLATPNETADTGIVQVIPETGPSDPATSDLVRELRSHQQQWHDEFGIDIKVTGFTAVAIDISDQLADALLPFGIFVVGLSFVLLTIVFRSLWVPLKATLGYLLSILAAFGVVTAVFEWGWGAEALHVTKEGPVIAFMPIVVMGVLFGLAMDYEVFLVSRMREEYVHRSKRFGATRDVAIESIRSGYTASARVVTAAAVIMFAVFAAFVPEGDSNIKPIALALAVGIAVDAFLIRMTLVPAIMALLGTKAWWLPRWLARRLPHLDIEGEAVEREEQLAGWPERPAAIAARSLTIRADDHAIVEGIDVSVAEGESLVLASDDPHVSRAVLLAFAGRVSPDDNSLLRVGERLLPSRAGWVRANVGLALLQSAPNPRSAIRSALDANARIVLIDGADDLSPTARKDIAAVIRADDETQPLTVVVTAHSADSGTRFLDNAGRPGASTLTVTRATIPTEVNA